MAHEISINQEGQAEAAFAYQPAWHGLGTVVQSDMTPMQALEIAHLNWTVEKHPLFFQDGSIVPERVGVRRSDNGVCLATVGENWVPIQNEEQAQFIESLTGEGASVVNTVGAIREGRRTFWTIKVPGQIILPGNDQIDKYLVVVNGHDGLLSFKAFWSPIRVVCNNTLNAALTASAKKGGGISLPHRSKVKTHLDAARTLLGLANQYYADLGQKFLAMMDKAFSDAEFKLFVDTVVPQKPGSKEFTSLQTKTREAITNNFSNGVGSTLAGKTAWGAYNAVTEYEGHQKNFKNQTRRFESIILTPETSLQQKAFDVACKML